MQNAGGGIRTSVPPTVDIVVGGSNPTGCTWKVSESFPDPASDLASCGSEIKKRVRNLLKFIL
ncbi:MAG TPA: hypothetical protein VEC08_01305 [Nitrososphaerales archaeon]|nr:hypothetical protein [Nitrososphaerales archaeon]